MPLSNFEKLPRNKFCELFVKLIVICLFLKILVPFLKIKESSRK